MLSRYLIKTHDDPENRIGIVDILEIA